MEIYFLGTGTITPNPRRAPPGIILKLDNYCLLFDSGPGTVHRMKKAGFSFNDIDILLYTHFHIDHIGDLPSFIFCTKYHLAPREKPLKIIGPKGIKEFYFKLLEAYGEQLEVKYKLTFKEMARGRFITPDFSIFSEPVEHTRESIAYKVIKDNKTFVYSGDTDYCKGLIRLAKNADILILECSLPRKMKGHLDPEHCGKIAAETNCKKLVLTHFYPETNPDEAIEICRKYYSGEIIAAEDGICITV